MRVLRINASDTHPIRQEILRKGFPEEALVYEGDEEEQTFHLGVFIENHLVSIASFYYHRHPDIEDEYQYRLRGMATRKEHRRQGLSTALLKTAFPIVKQNQCSLVWCNARETAVSFYEKLNFQKQGKRFQIQGIGPHFLMVKKL